MMVIHKIPAHRGRRRFCEHCNRLVPMGRKDRFCREKCRALALEAKREERRRRVEAVAGAPGALGHVKVAVLPPGRVPLPREVRV